MRFPPSLLEHGIPSAAIVKTAAFLALVAAVLPAGAAAAVPVTVDPVRAAVGETITVSGPPGRRLARVAASGRPRRSRSGGSRAGGTLAVRVPDVPRGSYRVVVAGLERGARARGRRARAGDVDRARRVRLALHPRRARRRRRRPPPLARRHLLVGFGNVLGVALLLLGIRDRRSLVLVVPVVLAWVPEYPDRS